MYAAAARDPAAPGACEAALAAARLAGDVAHDASVAYAQLYRVQRRFAPASSPPTRTRLTPGPRAPGRSRTPSLVWPLSPRAAGPRRHRGGTGGRGDVSRCGRRRIRGRAGAAAGKAPQIARIESWPGRDTARVVVVLDRPAPYRIGDEASRHERRGAHVPRPRRRRPRRCPARRRLARASWRACRPNRRAPARASRSTSTGARGAACSTCTIPIASSSTSRITRQAPRPARGAPSRASCSTRGTAEGTRAPSGRTASRRRTSRSTSPAARRRSSAGRGCRSSSRATTTTSSRSRSAPRAPTPSGPISSCPSTATRARSRRGAASRRTCSTPPATRSPRAWPLARTRRRRPRTPTSRPILGDLRLADQSRRSTRFAQLLERAANSALGARYGDAIDGGVHTAGFYVLVGADMPSVLFETSYISNVTEEQRLGSDEYRQLLADAIANAVKAYREGR